MIQNKKLFSWLMLGFMLVMALAPALAFGQAPDTSYTLSDDDLSKKTFIDPLFGPLIGDTESPLTGLMLVFNGILLTVGGILVAYTIFAGTLSTAHDGEMLGKRWSTLWVPVRTALGAAAVMPVVGGGWCVAQVIVIWLAMQGAAMANVLWAKFIDNGAAIITSATYAPPSSLSAIRQSYTTMFINSVCVAAKEGARTAAGGDAELMGMDTYLGHITDDTPTRFSIAYGSISYLNAATAGAGTRCGQLILDEQTNAVTRVWNGATNNTGSMLLDLRSDDFNRPISDARRSEFRRAHTVTTQLAKQQFDGSLTQAEFDQAMNELLQSYSTNMAQVAQTVFSQHVNNDFLNRMKQDGWIMAGAFYMQMSRAQDQITRSITNAPVTSLPALEQNRIVGTLTGIAESVGLGPGADAEISEMEAAQQVVSNYSSSGPGGAQGVAGVGEQAASANGGWSSKVVSWFINEDSVMGTGMADTNENPIIMAKNLGDKMTATAWGALGAATIASAAAGLTQGSGVSAAVMVAPIFMVFFSSLLVPGAILSTYLPMMPYIMWLGVGLAWAILLIEAVIAAPLWAIVHLAPDGDGVVGRGGQGYMLVLSLVLRPPLMILGLVAAFVLMKPVGFLVNSTFVGAFSMSVTPGVFGLTQTAAGCIIYCVIMLSLVQRIFSLIHVVPDRTLRWIGGGGGEIGEHAQVAGEGYTKAAGALGAHQAIGQTAQHAAQGMAAQGRQNRDHALAQEMSGQQGRMAAESKFSEDGKQAEISNSKAGRVGDASSHMAAANAYDQAQRSGFSAAEQSAKADKSDDASNFNRGLAEARKSSAPGAERAYMETASASAAQEYQQYSDAQNRIAQGTGSAADKELVSSGRLRDFEVALAKSHNYGQLAAQNRRTAQSASSASPRGSDSVRDSRNAAPPPAASEDPDVSIP